MTVTTVGVGDVLTIASGSWVGEIVELGERLLGEPHLVSHVIVAHHQDKRGTWWGIEGRPGGVGWQTLERYLGNPLATHDNSNAWEERTDLQRVKIARLMEGVLGVGYDWIGGIAADFFDAVKARELAALVDKWWGWGTDATGRPRPGHVVCSSLASWGYGTLGLPHPEVPGELTTPGDWWLFNHRKGQEV